MLEKGVLVLVTGVIEVVEDAVAEVKLLIEAAWSA